MFIVLAYIKFLLRSTNQHGVHSPFVYNFVTKCFYDRKKYPAYKILKRFRRSLLTDDRVIQVKDFGAGSRVFKSESRKISEIAKHAGINSKRTRLLNRLVRYLNIETALELGTSVGLATAAMAAGNKTKVTTLEGCPETAKIAEEKFGKFGLDNVELKMGIFEKYLVDSGQRTEDTSIQNSKFRIQDSKTSVGSKMISKKEVNSKTQIPNSITLNDRNLRPDGADLQSATSNPSSIHNTQYSLLYIDGNHQKKATLLYFEKLLPHVHNDSVMIFDDIHWSAEMEAAWKEIKAHPQVTVTIDTFQWGLVFFRREQEKEHFVIRV